MPDELEAMLEAQGIETRHQCMDNGEFRFRLVAGDGSAYIRTVAGSRGAWQRSHYHNNLLETYIVQDGWIALVELVDDAPRHHILVPGTVFTTKPGVAHNVYMPAGAVTHTVKHGADGDADWHASPELDSLTRHVPEAELAGGEADPQHPQTD